MILMVLLIQICTFAVLVLGSSVIEKKINKLLKRTQPLNRRKDDDKSS